MFQSKPVLTRKPSFPGDLRSEAPSAPQSMSAPPAGVNEGAKSASSAQIATAPNEPIHDHPAETENTEEQRNASLIVGAEVKLRGAEIQDCDTLVVEGRVEATMDSRVIRIAAKGSFVGKVAIDVADIRGIFEGELTAREQLTIRSGARVSGKIRYGKLLVEAGGVIGGDVGALSPDAAVPATNSSNVKPLMVTTGN